MQQFTDVIMQFVNKMGYLRSKDIEGIIFYGSNQTGFGNQFSDIDLHIIFNNNLKEEIRGSDLIDGIRIEYFEKTLNSMYQKTINEFKNQITYRSRLYKLRLQLRYKLQKKSL